MIRILTAFSGLLALAGTANAGIPHFNATCPTGIEVHAPQGGPIYINGKEAKLQVFNENAYEAKHGHATISLTINPDGTPSVAYTKQGGANGICTVVESRGGGHSGGGHKGKCPADVSEADRYKYPACN